jgi:putative membrane protein
MIVGYSEHAANERTYLAWVRTGIAVVAFGFVIEKFNLFLRAMANTIPTAEAVKPHFTKLSQGINRYEGLIFILGGVGLMALATLRFVRTTRLLNDQQTHLARSVRIELILSTSLIVLMAAYSIYLVIS